MPLASVDITSSQLPRLERAGKARNYTTEQTLQLSDIPPRQPLLSGNLLIATRTNEQLLRARGPGGKRSKMDDATTSYSQPPPDEEVDVCRVCRSGQEEGELYWPCQCSGSMRFVHETCLNDWIAARGSNPNPKCELCHTPLSYTKVYDAHMPSQLPLHLLVRHVLQSFAQAILFVLRAFVVAAAWLAVLPYAIVHIFRFLLWTADSLGTAALLLTGRTPQQLAEADSSRRVGSAIRLVKSAVDSKPMDKLKEGLMANVTAMSINWTTGEKTMVLEKTAEALAKAEATLRCRAEVAIAVSPNPIGNLTALAMRQTSLLQEVDKDPWKILFGTLASDTFRGQIITSIVVVLFVICFLLREWIVMNGPAPDAPPPAPEPAFPNLEVAEIAGVVAELRARADQGARDNQQAAQVVLAMPPRNAPREVWDTYLEGLRQRAREHAEQPEPIERDLRAEGAEATEPEQPVASTSRLDMGRSTSPVDFGDDRSSSSWVDMSDEEVETALLPTRRREGKSRARSDESEEEGHAGPVRSGVRGSPEAARRRREERTQREERARRRATRQESAGPSFPTAPPSPERPIRSLPARRARSTTPFDDPPHLPPAPAPATPPLGDAADLPHPTTPLTWDQPPPLLPLAEAQGDGAPVAPAPPLLRAPDHAPAPEPPAEILVNQAGLADEEPFAEDVFDDLEGVLDAIGMRGSMLTLVQNMGLMILLIALCLAGGVWVPLSIGRVLAASNALRLITMPLRAVRTISDPLFDGLFTLLSAPPRLAFRLLAPRVLPICAKLPATLTEGCMAALVPSSSTIARNATEGVVSLTESFNSTLEARGLATVEPQSVAVTLLKSTLAAVAHHWTRMALDDDPLHRGLCVALGYASALLAGAWYLQITQSEYSQQVDRVIREGIKQQLTLLKVCLFVFVEIIIFPGTCGLLLSAATIPLYPNATLASRLAFHLRAPFSAYFISWITGTAFMFAFASSIDMARGAVRPGLVWFIRDPQAAEFHPIREILERSSRTQARKIATSAVLYGAVIALTFGANILFLRYACAGVLPLRWPTGRSFSLPVDLIIYQFIIPMSMRAADPRARARKLLLIWTKRTAHALRLSSFVFGHRDLAEEGTHIRRTWHARLTLKRAGLDDTEEQEQWEDSVSPREVVFRKDGGFGRVPAVDTVKVAPKRPMLVRVTEEGHPIDDLGTKVIAAQLVEMATTRKGDAYRVVYLPPNFNARIWLFVYLLWFTGSLAICGSLVAPLLVGRYLFTLVTSGEVHDLYSITVGAYTLAATSYLVHHRSAVLAPRVSRAHLQAVASIATFIVLAGLILPTLLSFIVLAFVRLPLSLLTESTASPDSPPTIYLLHCWATGTVGLAVLYRLARYFIPRNHPLRVDLDQSLVLFRAGTLLSAAQGARLANWYLSRIAVQLSIFLSTPLFFAHLYTYFKALVGHQPWPARPSASARDIARYYAGVGSMLLGMAVNAKGKRLAQRWVQRKLEETYLVEKKLRNYEKVEVDDGDEGDEVVRLEDIDE